MENGISSSFVRDFVLSRRVGEGDLSVGEDVFPSSGTGGFDVEDEEFDEVRGGGEGGEGISPVDGGGEVDGVESGGIDELEGVGDSSADGEGAVGRRRARECQLRFD